MIGSGFIHLIRTDSDAFLFIAELIFHFVYVPQLLLEKGMATHSRQRSLVGYSGWGRKDPDTTEWLSHHNFLILSSADGHLGHFHVLTIVNSAAMKTRVHVSLSVLVSSGYMPSSGIAESYGSSSPSFLRNLHAVFHSSCTSLHCHHSVRRFPFLCTISSIYCFIDFQIYIYKHLPNHGVWKNS